MQAWPELVEAMKAKYQAGKPLTHRAKYTVLPCKAMGVQVSGEGGMAGGWQLAYLAVLAECLGAGGLWPLPLRLRLRLPSAMSSQDIHHAPPPPCIQPDARTRAGRL